MRGKDGTLVALEVPYQNNNNNDGQQQQQQQHNYPLDFDLHLVYRPICLLNMNKEDDAIEKSGSSSSI